MKALIVGAGSIGSRRARILKSLGHDVTVCDSDTNAAVTLGAQMGWCISNSKNIYFDSKTAIESEKFDVVLTCTPPETHLDIALQAAQAGCHLFIEKPLSNMLNKAKVKQLVEAMQVNGCIGIMGQSYRFLPSLRDFCKLIRGKQIVSASIVSGQNLDDWWKDTKGKDTPYAKQGVIEVSLAHSLDTAQWLFGGIEHLIALGSCTQTFDDRAPDLATVLLRMTNGAQVMITNDFLSHPRRDHIQAVTIDGEVFNWDLGIVNLYSDTNVMYECEMRHLMRCVENKYQGQPDLSQGILNLELTDLVKESIEQGRFLKPRNVWKEVTGRK